MNFTVIKRNYGHWDICTDKGRAFRIRGTPGNFIAMDEREKPYPVTKGFKTVATCMAFIADEMMFEEITADADGVGNNHPTKNPEITEELRAALDWIEQRATTEKDGLLVERLQRTLNAYEVTE